MKNMRILHISNNYTPYCAGLVSSLNALLPALQHQGHTIRLLTIDFLGDHHDDPEYVVRIASVAKGMYRTYHLAVPWRMRNFVARQVNEFEPDIIHVHHPFLLGMAGLYIAQVVTIPIVFTYHSQYQAYAYLVPFAQSLTQTLIKKRVNHFCNEVNALVVPSGSIEQMLKHECVVRPMRVIPSPIQSHFIDTTRTIKENIHAPLRLLLVSRLVPEKNIEWLLHMLSKLDISYSLTIAGFGILYEPLQKYVKELGITNNVIFVEKPDRQTLINLYQNCDLFVFSSLSDTQALVLAEAMSFGTPVVALDGPGQRDIIHNGVNGFLAHNADQMVDCITRIQSDTQLFKQLSAGALETSRYYHPDQIARELTSYYKQIICPTMPSK